jgi:hypothetical protein
MIEAKTLQKYSKYSTPQLIEIAERHFNKYIRKRDGGKGCICCGGKHHSDIQAGHYYSGGHYPNLRFNPDNVHGQSRSCNYFKHGNLIEYRKYLLEKIGEERLAKLDFHAADYKRNGFKWERVSLIQIIEIYKAKNNEV